MFPVTRSLVWERVPEDVQGIHRYFVQVIQSARGRVQDPGQNHFLCAFRFVFRPPRPAIIINLVENYVITNKPRINPAQINLRTLGASNDVEGRCLVFRSHVPDQTVYDSLAALHLNFLSKVGRDDAATKNQAMLLSALDERSVSRNGNVRPDVWSAMRSTDSEAGAIYVLQHKYVIDNIIDVLCEVMHTLPVHLQVTSIEFHGCTTRDMCALCFTNMNIIQYLSNDAGPYNTMEFSFLRYLRHILTHPITLDFHRVCENATIGRQYATPDCFTKMFISSITEVGNNLNFQAPVRAAGEGEDFLYQFRVVSPEARAIVGEIEADRARGVLRM